MTAYAVVFERVGRSRNVPSLTVEGDADTVAEAVFREARKHLGSSWFDVTVDLDAGKGWIESGRFGTFTVAPS